MRRPSTTLLLVLFASACGVSSDDAGDGSKGPDVQVPDTDPAADTGDTDRVVPEVVPDITWSGVKACAEPAKRQEAFWDMKYARRLPLPPPAFIRLVGGGVALADLTGDGHIDVFMPGIDVHQIHVNQGDGTFVEQFDSLVPNTVDLTMSTGASVADVEGDGDLDVFVTRWNLPDVLLLNEGDGSFVDGTSASGITGTARGQTSTWGDLDGDGDLDLFVGNYGPKPADAFAVEDFEVGDASQLWENQGDGTFVDRSTMIPGDLHAGYTFMAGWHDLDGDLAPELLVVNDFGWARPSRLLWNRGGTLQEDDGGAGFHIPFAGMGLGVGDVNGDGVPDFAQSSWKASSLLLSVGGPTWGEAAEAWGFLPTWEWGGAGDEPNDWNNPQQIFGWGTELVDIDNDADLDLLVNFGAWDEWSKKTVMTDALYLQDANRFTDHGPAWGFDTEGPSRGLATADLNGDGWPDVVKRVLDERTPMYLSRCGDAAWLKVVPRMPAPNTFAVGTRITVRHDGAQWVRWITGGGTGMYGSGPPEALVGLGDRDTVDAVEIAWPDGVVTTLEDVQTRRVLDIRRTDRATPGG